MQDRLGCRMSATIIHSAEPPWEPRCENGNDKRHRWLENSTFLFSGVRQQLNLQTSALDVSQLYGANLAESNQLRDFGTGGQLYDWVWVPRFTRYCVYAKVRGSVLY